MIRRAFWLVTGAALGIAGYRRLTRAAKELLPRRELPGRSASTRTASFVGDVRAGMAEYMDRHRDI